MIKDFKFFNENKYNIEFDPLYHLDVYQNMALGLISSCMRENRSPILWKHHFRESGLENHRIMNKCLEIQEILLHNNFETPHVKIKYNIHIINCPGDANMTDTTEYTFHLAEDVFNSFIRRYENI